MQERENIQRILESAKEAIKKKDSLKLKELSNQTVHTASITHDPDNIAIAVIVYSLSKLIEREYYNHPELSKDIISSIDYSLVALKKKDEIGFKRSLDLIRKAINKISGNMRKYIQDVFRKASINKASKIYEHGISMEKTASLLGITMFELASYAGQTEISDVQESKTMDVKSRIKLAVEMFR
ncbi:MAG: hypothetical protein KKF68_00930 [Nanoarchaeota archaeon]|nr:hypothetical protein [Nanoarchaeota archaeon]